MPQHVEAVGLADIYRLNRGAVGDLAGEVPELTIDAHHHGGGLISEELSAGGALSHSCRLTAETDADGCGRGVFAHWECSP